MTAAVTAAAALRALHFAAAAALFGEFLFALAIAGSSFTSDAVALRRLARVAAWATALVAASGALWLLVQARSMSGEPFSRERLAAVAGETRFGRVAVLRLGLAIALAAVLVLLRRVGGAAILTAGTVVSGAHSTAAR